MSKKRKNSKKNTDISLLTRVYEDLKNRKKINEKKEIKLREEQLKRNQRKIFQKEKDLDSREKQISKAEEENKNRNNKW